MTNPLLDTWEGPFGLPPYDKIRDAHFASAFQSALDAARAEVAAIAEAPASADFDNTIAALDSMGEDLTRVEAVFYSLLGPCSTPERREMAVTFGQDLSAFQSDLHANRALFDRIGHVWQNRADLDPDQARLTEVWHQKFTRGGANLAPQEAARMAQVMGRLSELGNRFTQAIVEAEDAWALPLEADALAELPSFLQAACIQAGGERGQGPVVTLARSIVVPFLQFSPRRDLRRKAYEAWMARGEGTGLDNRARAKEILALRAERAALLGFENFARFKLDAQMAGSPEAVRALLDEVWTPARAAAQRDADILVQRMASDGITGPLEPWDWRYYAEARRAEEFDLDEAEVKPYFQLDRMIEAAFACAGRLFGLEFTPIEAPLWHPDCRAWQVTRQGQHMAVFIGDYFARAGKKSGAWCSAIQGQRQEPSPRRPQVVNICNFAKGTPALLSFDDARTLFHEFGHALHYFLTDTRFASVSGLKVERDFVELPSQLFEHWLSVPEVLDQYATHVETGAPMPQALRDRVLAAATYDAGFATVEYLSSALVDLGFHDGPPPGDVMQKQAEILAEIGMPPAIRMRHPTPAFAHVFAGDGYSCGYYSYMWSEVMDADAFDAFTETGDPFNPDVARALEREILSTGHTRPARAHYLAFRGRMPGVEPLLRGRGLDDLS